MPDIYRIFPVFNELFRTRFYTADSANLIAELTPFTRPARAAAGYPGFSTANVSFPANDTVAAWQGSGGC
jgi:hypothetical protein